jgi:predicted alpha/beta superfamily hydrolase
METFVMKYLILSSFFTIAVLLFFMADFPSADELTVGIHKTEVISTPAEDINQESFPRLEIRDTERRWLKSRYINQKYEIDVFLPKGYREETKQYPVVYILDAEYNFGCVAYITRRLIKNEDIPKVLLVGIAYNTTYQEFYRKRERDLTPASSRRRNTAGGAENFSRFLREDLMPFINKNYRTISDDCMIVGHSYGGLFGSYTLLNHPGLFKRYILVSLSI